MERREGNERALQSIYNIGRMSHPTYRPILPRLHRFSSIPPYLRRFLQKSRSCIRHLCACSSGFNFVLLLCLSPLHWVQFVVLKDRQKLLAGLWTLCHHDLCWGNALKAPCTCLLFCLIFFLLQVKLYSKNVLEPRFLIVYHINWLGSILYMMIGFLSVLNHLSSQVPPPDQNLFVIPITRTRVGNMATVKLSLSEGDSGVSSCMSKAPERQLSSVVQSRAQAEAET
ncbi:TPA: transmembrane protein 202-like [Bos taurus]|nr:TPA: transmembrane protein 202-like [Bos taurus]